MALAGTYTNNTEAVTDASFDAVEARYVRVSVTDAGADGVARIGDLEVYGSR